MMKNYLKCFIGIACFVVMLFLVGADTKASDGFVYADEAKMKLIDLPNEETLVIPEGVKKISSEAFGKGKVYDKVHSIEIPSTLEYIDLEYKNMEDVFPNLKEVAVEKGSLHYLYENGILYQSYNGVPCRALAAINHEVQGDVKIPDTVSIIVEGIFQECTQMTTFTLGLNTAYILEEGEYLEYIDGSQFLGCTNLQSFKVTKGNEYYKAIEGSLYNKSGDEEGFPEWSLTAVPQGYKGEYVVLQGTMEIGNGAFYGCQRLTSIRFTYGVTRVSNRAIVDCPKLVKVKVPSTIIELDAFKGNDNLSIIKIQDKNIVDIDKTQVRVWAKKYIELRWKQVLYAKGYRVQMKKNGKWRTIEKIKEPYVTAGSYDTASLGLQEGKIYYFRVVAYHDDSVKSISRSYKACFFRAPKIKTVKNTARGTVTVKWKKSSNVTGYRVEIVEDGGTYRKVYTIKGKGKTRKIIKGLKRGKSYTVYLYKYRKVRNWSTYSVRSGGKNIIIRK